MREYTYTLTKEDEETPLKDLLRKKFDFSSRLRAKIKRERLVFLNGKDTPMWSCGKKGDVLSIRFPEERSHFTPEDIPVDVIYEDQDILVINKQPGYICHPTKGHVAHTMANGIMKYMLDSGQSFKIRFINRLDMDTSGILLIGKTAHAQSDFMKKAESAEKIYTAVVTGNIENEEGIIDAPIGKIDPEKVERGVVPEEKGGLPSLSKYRVCERFSVKTKGGAVRDFTLVRVLIKTGRTHQIRVHMAHIGHPVVGDHLYGEENPFLIERHALHAEELSFEHPATGKKVHFHAEKPEDMKRLIRLLRNGTDEDKTKAQDAENIKKNYVYIVRCADDSLYTGWTTDVEKRIQAHNSGKGAKYTRSRGPVTLVYHEELPTKEDALKREAQIKKMSREKKLKLVEENQCESKNRK